MQEGAVSGGISCQRWPRGVQGALTAPASFPASSESAFCCFYCHLQPAGVLEKEKRENSVTYWNSPRNYRKQNSCKTTFVSFFCLGPEFCLYSLDLFQRSFQPPHKCHLVPCATYQLMLWRLTGWPRLSNISLSVGLARMQLLLRLLLQVWGSVSLPCLGRREPSSEHEKCPVKTEDIINTIQLDEVRSEPADSNALVCHFQGWRRRHRLRAPQELCADGPRRWTGRTHHCDRHGLHWKVQPEPSVPVQVSGYRGERSSPRAAHCCLFDLVKWKRSGGFANGGVSGYSHNTATRPRDVLSRCLLKEYIGDLFPLGHAGNKIWKK